MGRKSNLKGKRGERELARWLTERGFPATRSAPLQARSGDAAPDLDCPALDLWIECKRTERVSPHRLVKEASEFGPAVVFHRPNNGRWIAILDGEVFLDQVRKKAPG